jgi:predicted ATP-binding protein involved in virulence
MEDRENEQIRYKEASENPQLAAVRRSIEKLVPGFRNLRIRRQGAMGVNQPRLTVEKDGAPAPLILDALSEGERTLIAMVADIARRLVLYYPTADNPLGQPAVILIDEIEQHLHPGWQRSVVRQLRSVFTGAQFIVTTQSPIVVSEIEPRCLRLIRDFTLVERTEHRAGTDVNEILEATFCTPPRREKEGSLLSKLKDAIDDGKFKDAKRFLDELELSLGEHDREVVYHRTLMDRLE